MIEDVFILGIYSTPAGRFPERSPKDLVREAYLGALNDAGIGGCVIGHVWFSNMMLDFWGQANLRGQVCLLPLVEEGLLPAGVATTNVEAACASGSLAFNGVWKDILSGQCAISLAIGMEKMYDPARRAEFFFRLEKGTDFLDPQHWMELYKCMASACGTQFEPSPERSIAMDICALWAKTHMARYGTTAVQIACAAAKNHTNSVANPRAQYRFPMDADAVLVDRMVCEPLTRACARPSAMLLPRCCFVRAPRCAKCPKRPATVLCAFAGTQWRAGVSERRGKTIERRCWPRAALMTWPS